MAHPKHQQVRLRYEFRCGYCGVSEIHVGSELTVDHYRPLSAFGSDEDENLVYACIKCNQYKGDFFPDSSDHDHGWYVLHPLRHRAAEHFQTNRRTGYLEPLTETGRFHVNLLQLNRPALVEHRLKRRLVELLEQKEQLLEAENSQLRVTIAAQKEYIRHLRNLLRLQDQEP